MDEIVKAVSEKTGLPESQARKAAEAVIDEIKERAPAPIASQIDGIVSGGGMSDTLKGLGGMFGR